VAEFLVLLGLFQVDPWITVIAALGLITGAAYSLILMQKSFQGTPDPSRTVSDYGFREMSTMTVMIVALIVLGVFPQPVLDIAQPVLQSLLDLTGNSPGGIAVISAVDSASVEGISQLEIQ
jgi:NADH-quinone oxidoreductase subunit M